MAEKTTDKQKKEDILDTDLEYLINEEEKLQEKLKDSSHLERFAKDLMLFMSLIKDYYQGNYRDIPYKTISAGVVGLLYTLNPIDIIPDFIPFIGHIDDALVLTFCLKLVEKDLKNIKLGRKTNRY
ncbi:YkvA family protein [Psychrobacter sp. WY6]|uniref:YkvA family protein n=1 Tax=Psychrobacter sp. WY6 TaxID=2708350 RepID=UPI002022C097|nr:YkvA family protein [Psychrobacter sp. WY6]